MCEGGRHWGVGWCFLVCVFLCTGLFHFTSLGANVHLGARPNGGGLVYFRARAHYLGRGQKEKTDDLPSSLPSLWPLTPTTPIPTVPSVREMCGPANLGPGGLGEGGKNQSPLIAQQAR